MSRVSYVNGIYLHHNHAKIHIEDRGNQFADAVYEVVAIEGKVFIDFDHHLDRLFNNLNELNITQSLTKKVLFLISKEVVRRNRVDRGLLYIQISRGKAMRNHAFPKNILPSIIINARSIKFPEDALKGVKVKLMDDLRWKRCDIKSVSLLPNVLAKEQAVRAGAYEAWLVDSEGYITEGSSSNAWILNEDNILKTPPLSNKILGGITRKVLKEISLFNNIEVQDIAFSTEEAKKSKEAFITSTSNFILPVTYLDNEPIGKGEPGPLFRKLYNLFCAHLELQIKNK